MVYRVSDNGEELRTDDKYIIRPQDHFYMASSIPIFDFDDLPESDVSPPALEVYKAIRLREDVIVEGVTIYEEGGRDNDSPAVIMGERHALPKGSLLLRSFEDSAEGRAPIKWYGFSSMAGEKRQQLTRIYCSFDEEGALKNIRGAPSVSSTLEPIAQRERLGLWDEGRQKVAHEDDIVFVEQDKNRPLDPYELTYVR